MGRELLRAPLQNQHYEDLALSKQGLGDLIEVLSSEPDIIDMQPLFFRSTLDVSTVFLLRESIGSLEASELASEQTFSEAFNTAQGYVAMRFSDLPHGK